jgi:hypothetical protein
MLFIMEKYSSTFTLCLLVPTPWERDKIKSKPEQTAQHDIFYPRSQVGIKDIGKVRPGWIGFLEKLLLKPFIQAMIGFFQ